MFKNLVKIVNMVQVRHNPRWSHRRPVRVLSSEEYEAMEKKGQKSFTKHEEDEEYFEEKENVQEIKHSIDATAKEGKKKTANKNELAYRILTTSYKAPTTKTTIDMLETTIDQDGNFVYKRIDSKDPKIGPVLTLIKSKKEKDKNDLILLEGKRLIKDALEAGCILKYLLFSRISDLEYIRPVLPKIGAKLYKLPYRDLQMWSDLTTNPGIMALTKTPEAENYEPETSIPLTVICDNIRDPGNLGSILRVCAAAGCEKVLLLKGCVSLWDSKVLRSAMGAHFKLQIHRNQIWNKLKEDLSPESNIFIADNNIVASSKDQDDSLKNCLQQLPLLPYYGVDFKQLLNVVLVIGGETHGISEESYFAAAEFKGGRVNVPLCNNVESLNVGTALGVIVFEIKKQLSSMK